MPNLSSYIALDVETTGLFPESNEIIELAAIKFSNGQVEDEFVTLIKPQRRIPEKITQITGITNSMVAAAPSLGEVVPAFMKFCRGETIVAHNAEFDMGFIRGACGKSGLVFENKVLCTLELARNKLNLDNNRLATVSKHFGLKGSEFHRAKADAIACGEIFWYLTNLEEDNASVCKAEDFLSEMPEVLTVSELNKYIKNLLDGDPNLINVSVCGEISNFKNNYSGHLYFSLKDDAGAIRAVMFKSAASHLKFSPEDGMKVVANGRISLYEATGQYQLYVETLTPYGQGDLHIAFEQLKEKLAKQGMFASERKKKIPKFPKRIGIVTSPTGSVIRDIIHVATRRFPACELVLYPAKVQGEGGAEDVCEGIRYFNDNMNVDTLIVGRGGGSIEDLWVFNEEKVAIAVANSKIPVISAVGHETDFTICDFAADLRAPTPSAAAEVAVPSALEIRENLKQMYVRMLFVLRTSIQHRKELLKRFEIKNLIDSVRKRVIKLDSLTEKLMMVAGQKLETEKNKIAVFSGKLDVLSPLKVMQRGFAIAQDANGNIIRSVKQLEAGAELQVILKDGRVKTLTREVVENG